MIFILNPICRFTLEVMFFLRTFYLTRIHQILILCNEPCDDDVDVGFELEEARKAITLSIIEVLLVSLP